MGREDGGQEVARRPRISLWLNLVGVVGFFVSWIVVRHVKGLGFESGSAGVGDVWMLALRIVVAIRPPAIRHRPEVVICRYSGSAVIDRKHCLGYTFRKAERVIGDESSSSNRGFFIS